MTIRTEVLPYLIATLAAGGGLFGLLRLCRLPRRAAGRAAGLVVLLFGGFFLFFFRDPARTPPPDPCAVVAGADGTIANIVSVGASPLLQTNAVRISIFLSLFDVHVNRAPVDGRVRRLEYHPGARYFTFQEKSSLFNEHSTIVLDGGRVPCLVHQIVGPVARRVVYWLHLDQDVRIGERIGMMKFGSRLDIVLPEDAVEVLVKKGDRVRAGETVVARVRPPAAPGEAP